MYDERDLDLDAEVKALRDWNAKKKRKGREEGLLDFIPRISPQFVRPVHLAPLVSFFERARAAAAGKGPPVFATCSVPPQHAKTETILHGLAWWVSTRPTDFLGYLSYNAEIAETKSRFARDYARLAGVELRDDTDSVKTWRTPRGGGLMARSLVGGAITGQSALRCLVIDDPTKSKAEAMSRVLNERNFDAFRASVWTRLHRGTSVLVNHTRWHEADLIGRIKADPELGLHFEHYNLPAISDAGEALWPEVMPLELLETKRAGSSLADWWSLYMGSPRPIEGRIFDGVVYYAERPQTLRVAIGVDLAYSAKTSADWNIALVLAEHQGTYYVIDVVRRQCTSTQWEQELLRLQAVWPSAPMRAYVGGTELGTVEFLRRSGVRLQALPAKGDKLVRATPVSAAWEQGKVAVPQHAEWLAPFLGVVGDFTGLGDAHDDDVDALAAAYDALQAMGPVAYLPSAHERRERADRMQRPAGVPRGRRQGAW